MKKKKRIYFEDLTALKPRLLYLSIIILGSILIFLEDLPFHFEFENNKAFEVLKDFGFLLLMIPLGKSLLKKNYFQWNKKGANVKINTFWNKNFQFGNVYSVSWNGQELHINTFHKNIEINLSGFNDDDVSKLLNILKEYTYFVEEDPSNAMV